MITSYKVMLIILICAFGCEALDRKALNRHIALIGLTLTGALFIAANAIL